MTNSRKTWRVPLRSGRGISLALAVPLLALGGCAPLAPDTGGNFTDIAIAFDEAGCPQGEVQKATLSKSRSQRVRWQAVDAQGKPIAQTYWVYFDPFKPSSRKQSNPKGELKSNPVADETPVGSGDPDERQVEFKYTIVGEGCDQFPLDPIISVIQ